MTTIAIPVLVGFAVVAGLLVLVASGAWVVRMFKDARRGRDRATSEHLPEGEGTSLDWAYGPRAARSPVEEAPAVTLDATASEEERGTPEQRLVPEWQWVGARVESDAALRHAERTAGEIVATAERTAARYEDSARRSAVAALDDAERKASEIVAAAEARKAELEETALRLEADLEEAPAAAGEIVAAAERNAAELEVVTRKRADDALEAARHRASEIVAAAERKAAELEESARRAADTARRDAESALASARRQASEIVAHAEQERSRLQNGLARERTLVADTRTKLATLLDRVTQDVDEHSAGELSSNGNAHDTLGASGWPARREG